MVKVEGITEWIGREVVDRDGEKAGKLEDVYYDTTDGEPAFALVKSGALGRSHTVAPLAEATLARDYVRLNATKDAIKDAPEDPAGGRLTGLDALRVLEHFGLQRPADLEGEERVCFQTRGAEEETQRKQAEVAAEQDRSSAPAAAAAGSAGAAAAAVDAAQEPDRSAAPEPDRDLAREPAAEASRHRGDPGAGVAAPAAVSSSAPDDDDPLARLAELERRVSALERRSS